MLQIVSIKFSSSFFLFFFSCSILLLSVIPNTAHAQLIPNTASEVQEPEEPEWPEDSLGRRTPRGTVSGFISAVSQQDYAKAANYLDLSSSVITLAEGAKIAQAMKRMLDQRGDILPYARLSDEIVGHIDDDLPPELDRVGDLGAGNSTTVLYLEAIIGPDGAPVWLFSGQTIKEIMAMDRNGNELLIDRILPTFLKESQWGGVPIGQWLAMFLLAMLAYFLAGAITRLATYLLRRFWRKAATEPTAGVIKAFALPVRMYVALLLFGTCSEQLGISIILRQRFSDVIIIVGIVAVLLLLWRLTEFIASFSERRLSLRGHLSGVSAILFLRRLVKIFLVIFGVIAILGAFGVDVTTGLAALGIGGLALALGAQKTMENFVGSVTLIADQPIRVGDFCKAGDVVGTVEQIGMRSTRIRTLDRTLVTIPNGEFSSIKIENYAHRDRFRFFSVFGLRYETSPDQMRYVLVELRSILYAHPKVDPDPARIRFIELGEASLNLEVFAYIHARDFDEFLEIREDLLLRMMDVVNASGTGFAFPSQTLYLARDKGLSAEKTQEAEQKVKDWKERGEMQIPGFDPGRIEQLKNSIAYPPEGSAWKKES